MIRRVSGFTPAHVVDIIDDSVLQAAKAGVILESAGSEVYSGRHVNIGGDELLNFGGCSYLGLELEPELQEGAIQAIRRYGTQFSFSRAYLESPLYAELESALEQMTEGHVLVTPSTTLAHIAALPVLIEPGDAVLVDQFAHASLHTATALLRDIAIEPLRHNRIDQLSHKVERLSQQHRHVWYLLDGLYSMLGDFAPMEELAALLDEHPQLHLYIDDAHSTSWRGIHGRGHALEALVKRDRVVVTLSLNKAFSAAGGALVFPDQLTRARVQRCGGPMLFSGPVQPPMLGAALASARLHLGPRLPALQQKLEEHIALVSSFAETLAVPLASRDPSPIFFIRCGHPDVTFSLVRSLRDRGLYVCPSVFPAVPKNKSGVRFTVSVHNEIEDVELLMQSLAAGTSKFGVQEPASGPANARAMIA